MTKRDFRHLHERLSRLEDAVGIKLGRGVLKGEVVDVIDP